MEMTYSSSNSLEYLGLTVGDLRLVANPYISLNLSYKTLGLYSTSGKRGLDVGWLSAALFLYAVPSAMVPWAFENRAVVLPAIAGLALPLLLNPEVRLFPVSIVNPYVGYNFDLISDSDLNPEFLVKTGVLMDISRLRVRAAYHHRFFNSRSSEELSLTLGLILAKNLR